MRLAIRKWADTVAHRTTRADVLAAVFLAGLAALLTWPLVANPRGLILGSGGDVLGALSMLRESLAALSPSDGGVITGLAYPDGLAIPIAQYLATWPSSGMQAILFSVFGPEAGLNTFIVLGLFLNGIVSYGLIRWLTRSAWAGIVCGAALMVGPSILFNIQTAPDFAQLWPLVALIWALVAFTQRPTPRRGLAAGLLAAVCIAWNPYWLLMGTVATATLLVVAVFQLARARTFPRPAAIGALAAPVIATYAGLALLLLLGGQSSLRQRDLQEFYTYSARPLEYLRPPASSLVPELGLPGIRLEANTYFYVGSVAAVLSLIALGLAIGGRLSRPATATVASVASLGLVAGIFSMPPTMDLGGMTVYFPSWFIAQMTTTWRIYGRFGLVVFVAVVLLAGIALAALLARIRSTGARALVGSALLLLVWLDYGPVLPLTNTPVASEPEVYRLLERQPGGAVAEFPLEPDYAGNYEQVHRRKWHGRPLLNGYSHDSPQERRALALAALSEATATSLRQLGVRFVVLDRLREGQVAGTPYAPGRPSPSFVRIGADERFTLYRVSAGPASAPVTAAP